jgi:prepilin-type processing-associated H-X9-DG protein
MYPGRYPVNCSPFTVAAKGDYAGNAGDNFSPEAAATNTGVFYHKSTIHVADITDGLSNTYLVGEKYLCPDWYETGEDGGDDDSLFVGANCDNLRSTYPGTSTVVCAPKQDQTGGYNTYQFGSAHSGTFNMSMCDGSVRSVSYEIDLEAHRCLGNRKEGKTVDGSKF